MSIRLGLLMVLPFALWGTAMAAMAPLLATGGPELVAALRLLPAGLALLVALCARLRERTGSFDLRRLRRWNG